MNNLNSIILEGNLTRDPEFKHVGNESAVCNFTVASNRSFKTDEGRKEEVGYFDIEVWARLAETCGEYLSKGRGVRVVGRLKQDRWTHTDGSPRSRVRIVGEHVEFQSRQKGEKTASSEETKKEVVPAY